MSRVKVYTQDYCGYCERAKALLTSKGVAFEEISLEGKPKEMTDLKNKTGLMTMPQIFIDDVLVGGYTELADYNREGKLDAVK